MGRLHLCGCLVSCLIGGQALAQGVVAERFSPAVTSGGYVITERPETAGPWRLGVGLVTSYARSPLYIHAGPFFQPLIHHMLSAEAMAAFGLWRFAEVALSLPVSLYRDGPGVQSPTAVGDLKLHLKGRLWTSPHVGFGLLGTLAFPTGDSTAFAGTGQVSFAPRFLVEGRYRWLRAGANLGLLLRQAGQAGDRELSHELAYSAGLGLRPHRIVELLGELYGSTELVRPWQERSMSPLEAGGGVALHLWHFALTGGASAGLVNGYGAPAWRAFLSLRFQQPPKPEPVLARRWPARPAETVTVTAAPPPPPRRELELAPPVAVVEPSTTTVEGTAEIVVTETELLPNKAVFFEVNRARVRADFYGVLDALARMVKERPQLGVIRIEGHTDATGDPVFNEQLSLRRAQAVREALISRGVPPARLSIIGFGPSRPVGDNLNPAGRSQNRRVVFYHEAQRDSRARQTAGRPGPL